MTGGNGISDRDHLLGRVDRFLRFHSSVLTGGGPRSSTPPEFPCPSLTISRQCGAGLSRLERPLLDYLDGLDHTGTAGWALFDQALLARLVEERRIGGTAPPLDARLAKFAVSAALCEEFAKAPGEWSLFNHSANAIRKVCLAGNALIVGRAGNHLAADLPNTFHVRLIASRDRRVDWIARRYRLEVVEAGEFVDETDKARERFVRRHAGAGIDDPNGYHLVLNTDHFDDAVAVRIIADSLHEWAHLRGQVGGPEPAGGPSAPIPFRNSTDAPD